MDGAADGIEVKILTTPMPTGAGWDNLTIIEKNTKYWNEINKLYIDNAIANGGDIRFIHDPRLEKNIRNLVADLPTNTLKQQQFKAKALAEGLMEIPTFTKMEYDYLISKGYLIQPNGLMIKP